jgi:signal transduction histidine kinase
MLFEYAVWRQASKPGSMTALRSARGSRAICMTRSCREFSVLPSILMLRITSCLELLTQVSKEGRNTLLALRTAASSESDLEEALSRLRGEFSLPANIDYRVITEGEAELLRPLIRDEVYLIVREALINAFRHSKATAIEVKVNYVSRNLRVSVRDNGCGIDEELLKSGREGHWGLANMRERAERIGGRLKISSRTNAGTVVRLWIPGKLAFQPVASNNAFWSWLTKLYPWRSERIIAKSSEEPPK